MTLLQSFLGFKKVKKEEFLASEIKKLEEEFETDLASLKHACEEIIEAQENEYQAKIDELADKKAKVSEEIMNFEKRTLELEHEHKMELFRKEHDAKLELEKAVMKLEVKHDEVILEKKQAIKAEEKEILALEKSKKKLELAQDDLDEMIKRVEDKKLEIAKKNTELAQQLRLLEAKASPDQVWLTAFQSGFSKAWGMMKPVMYDGFDKVKQEIADNAKMETLNGLQSVLRGKDGTDSEEN